METIYSRGRLMDMFHNPKQKYARKKNPAKRTSDIEWNLQKVIEEEERDIEMQAKSKERRMSIA